MPGQNDLTDFCLVQYPRLVGLLGLYCGDRHVAEELAQEALARACRDWRKVAKMTCPDAWVSKVAINLANSHFRRRLAERRARERLQRQLPRKQDLSSDATSAIAVRRAVAALPRKQRAVLVWHYYGDLTFKQIADVADLPEGTVKSLAHRAITSLRHNSGLIDRKEGPKNASFSHSRTTP